MATPLEQGRPLRVSEIFYSIQGESTFAGLPCAFIRLTGCSLRCLYCDTKYAYEGGMDLTLGSILDRVEELACPLVEITGGEPLEAEGTRELVHALLKKQYSVLLETNGTHPLRNIPKEATIIMDIKCPSSGFSDKTCWENLDLLSAKDEVKFVLADETDYRWALKVLRRHDLGSKHPVLFSPASPLLGPRRLAEWILRDHAPVRLQLQVHKLIWGEEARGV